MSLIKDLQSKAAAGTATAADTKKKTATQTAGATETTTEAFAISEAQIKSNPAYQIITDTKKTEQQRVQALIALRVYNKELTVEQNQTNLAAFNQFLLYSENKILEITQRSIEFTNDKAFSLFDETIQKLQANLGIFKGNIEPLVAAFGVMQKARDKGIPPHKLLAEVQGIVDDKKRLAGERAQKEEQLKALMADRGTFEAEALAQTTSLTDLQTKIETATNEKAAAEGAKQAEDGKFFLTRNKTALADAIDTISSATNNIGTYQRSITTLSEAAKVTADKLTRKNAEVEALQGEIKAIETRVTEIDATLTADDDTVALAKLLEITGKEFKAKREELTNSVKVLVSESVGDFEVSMKRFQDGEKEVSVMKDTVTNVGSMIQMVAKADAKVRVADADFITSQEAIVQKIRAEKGDEAVYDPEFEKAKEQLDRANDHTKEGLSIAGRTGEFSEKLTRHEGTYTGLKDAFRQKFSDAQRLRTNAAVDVSAKLLTTTKTLEMAIAGEKIAAVDDVLAELSSSSSKATKDIFQMVSHAKGEENERLAAALKQAIETAGAIDAATADLREKAREGIATREAMSQVRAEMETLNEGLGSVTANVEREMQGEGLKEAGRKAAERVMGVEPAAPKGPSVS